MRIFSYSADNGAVYSSRGGKQTKTSSPNLSPLFKVTAATGTAIIAEITRTTSRTTSCERPSHTEHTSIGSRLQGSNIEESRRARKEDPIRYKASGYGTV